MKKRDIEFVKTLTTPKKAAREMRVHPMVVYKMVKDGKFNSFKIGWNHMIFKDAKYDKAKRRK